MSKSLYFLRQVLWYI